MIKKEISSLYDLSIGNEASIREIKSDVDNIKKHIKKENIETQRDITLSFLTYNGIYFFSMMKSGTTYTINFLINYLNVKDNDALEPLSSQVLALFHSTHSTIMNKQPHRLIFAQEKILRKTEYSIFVHTHHLIKSLTNKNIIVYREPIDYIISKYHWKYKDRGSDCKIEDVWKSLADDYIKVRTDQIKLEREGSTLELKYENIVRDSNEFKRLLNFLNIEYDDYSYRKALDFSSVQAVKKLEEKRGSALIAPSGALNRPSFIRSTNGDDDISDFLKLKILNYIKGELEI